MITLGVTGGIGSGKTEVCKILESMGAAVFYADDEAKLLMVEDEDVRQDVIDSFGKESYEQDGSLNREYLATKVFGNDTQVRRLNNIVHPKVHRHFERLRQELAAKDVPLLVEEAALIYESGADQGLDTVAVVDAPLELRMKRVRERDDQSETEVRNRMGHQLPPEELRALADYVIENVGTMEDLRWKTEALYRHLVGE